MGKHTGRTKEEQRAGEQAAESQEPGQESFGCHHGNFSSYGNRGQYRV